MNRGFTLIEILIYTAITAVVGGLMVGIFLTVSQVHQRESASAEVTSQLNFITQTIGRLVREASNIEIDAGVSTSVLKLRMQNSDKDPTYISLVDGVIKLTEGTAAASDLTNSRVVVDALNFKKFVQYPGHDTISYDVQLTYNSQNPKTTVQRSLSSAIARVSAATFDSNILPGSSDFEIGQIGSAWSRVYLGDGAIGNPSYTFGNDTGLGIFKVSGTSTIGFSTQGLERMRISANGNIGIGTTEPKSTLQIGSTYPLTMFANQGGRIYGNNIYFNTTDLTYRRTAGGGVYPTWIEMDSNNEGNIIFQTAGPGAADSIFTSAELSSAPKMIIKNNGNVGIGTTTPVNKLTVKGLYGDPPTSGTTATSIFRVGTAGPVLDIGIKGASPYPAWLQVTDTDDLGQYYALSLQPNGGNVGIGTADPKNKLDISAGNGSGGIGAKVSIGYATQAEGNTSQNAGTYNSGRSYFSSAWDDNFNISTFDNTPNGNWTIGIGDGAGGWSGNKYIHMDNDGNVGIGTTDPASKFQVLGGYLQIPVTCTIPPASDCDDISEAGRMVLYGVCSGGDTANTLYVCKKYNSGGGWATTPLP